MSIQCILLEPLRYLGFFIGILINFHPFLHLDVYHVIEKRVDGVLRHVLLGLAGIHRVFCDR